MDQRLIQGRSNIFRLIYPDPESSIGLGKNMKSSLSIMHPLGLTGIPESRKSPIPRS
jgi:hypothetical protein